MAKASAHRGAPSSKKKPRHSTARKKAAAKQRAARANEQRRTSRGPGSAQGPRGATASRPSRGSAQPRGAASRTTRPGRDQAAASNDTRKQAGHEGKAQRHEGKAQHRRPRDQGSAAPGHRQVREHRDGRWSPRATRTENSAQSRHVAAPQRQGSQAPVVQPAVERPASQAPRHTGPAFDELGVTRRLHTQLGQLGFTTAFPIQVATIPDALAGRDILGRGRTGSGKTLAFGLPVLQRLAEGPSAVAHRVRGVILTPTRELAMQIADALRPLARSVGVSTLLVAGGMPYGPQLRALSDGVDLVVATPGRLIDLIERGAVDLGVTQTVVIDEADHMAEIGFLEVVTQILEATPATGQRLLFSATLDHGVDTVVQRFLSDPVRHEVEPEAAQGSMTHHLYLVHPHDKRAVIGAATNRPGRTVVFARTKLGCERVAQQLREAGVFAAALHGDLNQQARTRVLQAFRDGQVPVLVATDVAARGIHVDDVSLVLQIDPPADQKDYLHRAGRTARAGRTGQVVTLALPHQRKRVAQMIGSSGVQLETLEVSSQNPASIAATGGRLPEGPAVAESRVTEIMRPPRRPGGPRRSRPGQSRRPHRSARPQRSAAR